MVSLVLFSLAPPESLPSPSLLRLPSPAAASPLRCRDTLASGSDPPLEPLFRLAPPREPLLAADASLAKHGILNILVSKAKKTREQFVAAISDADWEILVLEAESTVVKCYKLNIDEDPSTASSYPTRTLPTVFIFKNGEKKDTVSGVVPKTTLTSSIEKLLRYKLLLKSNPIHQRGTEC
ncbi:hypothetical protein VNO80_26955 [Phaseolus coccineus]|uniref:Thioredoxin domain-containing protein n=1 Tax=Phaseolus coccineus TaxID=3886 RepID=A0AAN9QH58_PHACN